MPITANLTDQAIYSILILIGLIACFFGYRLIRAWMFLIGLQSGFLLGLWLGSLIFNSPIVILIVAILSGLLLAGVFGLMLHIGGFLAGAGSAVLLALIILLLFQASTTILVIGLLLALIAGGVAGVLAVKPFLVLATAFNGACLVVNSVFSIINDHPVSQSIEAYHNLGTWGIVLMLTGLIALVILGSIYQLRMQKRKSSATRTVSVAAEPSTGAPPSPHPVSPAQSGSDKQPPAAADSPLAPSAAPASHPTGKPPANP